PGAPTRPSVREVQRLDARAVPPTMQSKMTDSTPGSGPVGQLLVPKVVTSTGGRPSKKYGRARRAEPALVGPLTARRGDHTAPGRFWFARAPRLLSVRSSVALNARRWIISACA